MDLFTSLIFVFFILYSLLLFCLSKVISSQKEHVKFLEKQLQNQVDINMEACRDLAEDHTYMQNLCRKAGYSEFDVEGDSFGVPWITDLGDLLFEKIKDCKKL